MSRRFPGADDAADLFLCGRIRLRPGMNHEQMHRADQPDSLPTIAVRVGVWPAGRHRVVKSQLRRLKTQAVVALVDAVLFDGPSPLHGGTFFVVVTDM